MIPKCTNKMLHSLERAAFFVALFCVLPVDAAFAQGCSTCYTTAAAGGAETVHALRSGILVLLVPPVLIFSGVVALVWRWPSRVSPSQTEKV